MDSKTVLPLVAAGAIGMLVGAAVSSVPLPFNSKKLKLYYFDIPGKGEPIRLACAYGNLDLEDVRVTGAEFAKMKEDGKLTFGQLPALVVDEKTTLAQSAAIMRYVGKRAGLYPTNNDELAAFIDALVDQENDMFAGVSASKYKERFGFGCLDEKTVAAVRKSLNDEILPRHLGFFENILKKSKSGWLAGTDKPTIADFILVPRLEGLLAGTTDGISTNILLPYPRVTALISKLMKLPAIEEYYAKKASK